MSIPGYTYATHAIAKSPVSLSELEEMKRSALFTDDDLRHLRASLPLLKDQVEAILDVWYGFVAANPQLLASFTSKSDGTPIGAYLGAVRKRFGQWILDTARAEYDQHWLDYQHEIGLRHHRIRKNTTDGVAAVAIVPFRHLFALIYPITFTLKPFLAKGGQTDADVDAMHAAWVKSCILQVTLWSQRYVKDGDF